MAENTLLNPATTKRLDYTNHILSWTCPPTASPLFAKMWRDLMHIVDLLSHHPAMAENNTQTFTRLQSRRIRSILCKYAFFVSFITTPLRASALVVFL